LLHHKIIHEFLVWITLLLPGAAAVHTIVVPVVAVPVDFVVLLPLLAAAVL
jgi:hypothetical protein